MKCEEIREAMPDLASGLMEVTPTISRHLTECAGCAGKMEELRQTMALLDEWQTPEPSPYFDVRLKARVREEMAKPQAGWLAWFRRPVLATVMTLLLGLGVAMFFSDNSRIYKSSDNVVATNDSAVQAEPGTAVSDLQSLEKNHEIYADFDLLDDLEVQHDVVANP